MARHIARGCTEETATERQVRDAITRHLGEDDVVISGLRLHDNTYGDVEIDPRDVPYTALSRAIDLAVIVGERDQVGQVLGEKHLRRMERRQA